MDSFLDGVRIARYLLEVVRESDRSAFAVIVTSDVLDAPEPSLHVERIPGGNVLLQLFVPQAMSPESEDGWYNLTDPKGHNSFSERDISTIWDDGSNPGMVETRLSEGVLFAKKMYVPAEMALDAVNHLLEVQDLRTALSDSPWKYVGVI